MSSILLARDVKTSPSVSSCTARSPQIQAEAGEEDDVERWAQAAISGLALTEVAATLQNIHLCSFFHRDFLSELQPSRSVIVRLADRRPGPEVSEKAAQAISLINSWLADSSGYDERLWPRLKLELQKDRLSERGLFHDHGDRS